MKKKKKKSKKVKKIKKKKPRARTLKKVINNRKNLA